MVIVTGSRGLVGQHLCQALEDKQIKYVGVDLPAYDLTKFEEVSSLFAAHKPTAVIHCAAMSYVPDNNKRPYRAYEANVTSTVNLLELSRWFDIDKYFERFIYLSSASTYGDFNNWLVNEGFALRPKDLYGATKASADLLVQAYHTVYQLPTTIIRTSSVYGPGDKHPRLIKNFVENAKAGKPLVLEGNGQLRRDFTYVKDLVQGIILCLTNDKAVGEVFNISGGRDYSLNDVAMLIKKLVPQAEIVHKEGRRININRGELDLSKAKTILKYYPEYDLEKGIREML